MALIGRTLVLAVGIAGGVVTSQAPEFTQQYRQRLGGALEELRMVVTDFDSDAKDHALTRGQALAAYKASADEFLRDRGLSITQTIRRYESLQRQSARFANWPDAASPLVLVGETDAQLFGGAWSDFRPGVPVTVAGAIWAVLGFLLFALLGQGARRAGTGLAGAGRRRGMAATRRGPAAYHGDHADPPPEVLPDPDGPVLPR